MSAKSEAVGLRLTGGEQEAIENAWIIAPKNGPAGDDDPMYLAVEGIMRGRLEQLAHAANEAELRWILGEWLTEINATPAKAEAVGLEDVLAAHKEAAFNSREGYVACWCGENIPCDGLNGDDWEDALATAMNAHVADQIRAHYTAALRSPEVVEAAAEASADVMREHMRLGTSGRWFTETPLVMLGVALNDAALTAAAETIEAGR